MQNNKKKFSLLSQHLVAIIIVLMTRCYLNLEDIIIVDTGVFH